VTSMYWLSFTDEDGRNSGACSVKADSLDDALTRSWLLGFNPGGNVLAVGYDTSIEGCPDYLRSERPWSPNEIAAHPEMVVIEDV
jgi:hypothetical protein